MAAGWVAAAVLATATGVAAVAVIGRGLSGPAGEVMSAEEIDRALSAAPPVPIPTPTASPTATTGTPAGATLFRSAGGAVTARCEGRTAVIVSYAPANGYGLRELDRPRGAEAEVSFERGDRRVKVEVTCPAGAPVFAEEVDDD
jgi:hypothetical protein